ncbi:hypothetical protein ACI78T_07335 [Blastococcus sp. SYSU D00922]
MATSGALRRARLRLLPLPGAALGLAVLVAVLAAALVSAPLFVASAEQGAWEQKQDRISRVSLGATILASTIDGRGGPTADRVAEVDELDASVIEAARGVGLGTPALLTILQDPVAATTADAGDLAQVVSLPGAAEHVEIVDGGPADDGVLVPEALLPAGLAATSTVAVQSEGGASTEVPVSGVYRTPTAPLDEFWDGLGFLFLPTRDITTGDLVYPPAAIIAPQPVAQSVAGALGEDLFLNWSIPLDDSVGISAARTAADRYEALQAALTNPDGPVAGVIVEGGFETAAVRTGLPNALESVEETVDLLAPPVRAVGIGGGAAALVLVGAWAGHRMRRRDDELRSLVARGLSPARAAGDVVRESVLPVLVGGAAGGVAGWLLVRALGPSSHLPAGATDAALVALGLGLLAALLVLAAVTAALVTRLDQVGRGQAAQLLGRVPWLAVVTAITVVTVVPLVTRENSGRVDVLTLAVPLLVTVVVAGAVTALLPRLGSRADTRLRRLPTGGYLAARRVLAGSGTARLVVVTTALSLSLVVYAGALASSTDRTIAAKASVATGSDVVVQLPRARAVEGPLPAGAMVVGVEPGVEVLPGSTTANVLVVRPEEVAGVVRWNDALADRPLADLMAALSGYDGDRVPVILSGELPDGVLEGTGNELTADFGYFDLPVEVVARADAFPGQTERRPLLVADWDRYAGALEAAGRDPELVIAQELWARGEPQAVLDSLTAAGIQPPEEEQVTTAAEFADRPELSAQTWSLDYLRAVALAAGALGLVGLAMHAMAQQRRRTVAALLLGRMGMSRRSADASAGAEIGLLAGVAALVAVAVALPASALVLRVLDPVPALRPDALFQVPWSSLAIVLAGVVLVTAGSAVLVGRAARRATGGQVMRDAS